MVFMDNSREELVKIKGVIKEHPKGLSLSDISRLVNMNRHSVAKYMEMLAISGHVEMRSFGPSKVYYISQRVPISDMLSFSSDLIGTIDRNMNIVQANNALLEFFHFRREDLVGQRIGRLDHILPINNGLMELLQVTLDGKMHQCNIPVRQDGEIRYLRMRLVPAAFDDGTSGAVFIAEDITAEKRAVIALRESEERFHAVFDQAAVGITIANPGGYFIDSNHAYQSMLGYNKAELMQKSIYDITHPEDIEKYRQLESQLSQQSIDKYQVEKRDIRKDGMVIWTRSSVSAIRNMDGSLKYNIGVIEDITKLRKIGETSETSQVL